MTPKKDILIFWHEIATERGYESELDMWTKLAPHHTFCSLSRLFGCSHTHLRTRFRVVGAPKPTGNKEYKPRECTICLKMFQPTSASIQACPDCREAHKKKRQAEYRERSYEPSMRGWGEKKKRKMKARKKKKWCKCGQLLNMFNRNGICGACDIKKNGIGFVATEVGELKVNPI